MAKLQVKIVQEQVEVAQAQYEASSTDITEASLETANLNLKIAKLNLQSAELNLDKAVITAPFDGVVAKRLVNQGEYIRAGSAAFYLVRLNPIKFKGDVPERFAGDVRKDDQILAYTDVTKEITLAGTIVRVGPSIASDSRSFAVEAKIDNNEGSIKPGTFARISILTKKMENVLTVPEVAVFTFAGTPRVFVAKDGKVSERVIETAGKVRDRVLVAKGLTAG
jgi:membrane fusion protein (multidrug efflux system)